MATIDDVKNGYQNFNGKGFREFQRDAIEYIVGSDKKIVVACLPTGCLTGDTIINMNRGGNGDKVTLKNFYLHFNGLGDKRYNYDKSITTYVRAYNMEDYVGLHHVDDVLYSGKKDVYLLTLESGKTLKATREHKILTADGWKLMAMLTSNDLVLCDNPNAKKSSNKKARPRDSFVCNLWNHPFARKVTTKKDKRGFTLRVEIHRALLESHMNGISLPEFKEILRDKDTARSKCLKFIDTSIHEIHHIDGNHYNNEITNLQIIKRGEHQKLHSVKTKRNFNQGVPSTEGIVSIKFCGNEDTYDISCPDFENFVANGIIVHNSGKSLVGAVSAGAMGGGTYLVHSKALQVQLQNDFPEIPILWGRSNYNCLRTSGKSSCGECTHSGANLCENKASRCEYVVAKRKALNTDIRVLNYDYWITEANYVGGFGNENLVVVDEADSLQDVMSKFIGLEFTEGMMKNLGIVAPKYKTTYSEKSIDSWKEWAASCAGRVAWKIAMAKKDLVGADPDPDALKRIEKLTGVKRKLDMFVECVDASWVYDEREYDGKTSISFKPKWISPDLANRYVWSHGKKFVLMSATFPPLPVLAKELGVSMADISYREFPSTFPEANRPIIMKPVANLVYKEMEVESAKVIEEIRRLLEVHKNERGLIHTVNYKLARQIMAIGDPRLVTHTGGDKILAIEEFKASDKPLVMVSPSSERGISLDGDKCRWVVWVKCPFLSLNDKLVKARLFQSSVGNLWYKSNAVMTVVQGCGRAVRSKDDKAVAYILDKQIIKLITENPGLAPKWWRDACW